LTFSSIHGFIADPGETKTVIWNVKNTGTTFLNDCVFESFGDYASWVNENTVKSLSAGEEYEFIFDVNLPENLESGSYGMAVSSTCAETSNFTRFNIEVIEKKLQLDLEEVVKQGNQVKITYFLEELSGVDQNVDLEFLLFDGNDKVAETLESKFIISGSRSEFESFIDVDSNLRGSLNLLVNVNSETYSTFIQEDVILSAPLSGAVIFGDLVSGDSVITYVIIILFVIFAVVVIRRIFTFRKHIKHKNKKSRKKKK